MREVPRIAYLLPITRPETFSERANLIFEQRASQVARDRLHPFNIGQRFLQYDTYWEILDKQADIGVGINSSAFVYSGREIALDGTFFSDMKYRSGFFPKLFRGSVGSVDEEQIRPLEVPDQIAEESWWNRVKQSGNIRYGIRPFRVSPYAFVGFVVQRHGQSLVFGNVRYYYSHFTDHQFDVVLSSPLGQGMMLDIGLIQKMERDGDQERRVGVKFHKRLSENGSFFIGANHREVWKFYAGFEREW